jgi:hypothetical protein
MDPKEVWCKDVNGIHMAQNSVQWRNVVSKITNIRVSYNANNFLTSWVTINGGLRSVAFFSNYLFLFGVLGFDSRRGLGIFLFTTWSRTALGPTQPPIQWVPGVLSLGTKRLGRETDHSPPSSAEVKECVELYLHSCTTPSWRAA